MSKQEKIARMVGKTTYKDFREGFSGRSLMHDSDADIKGALGIAQQRVGADAVRALETRYASTLMHERALRRAWERALRERQRARGAKRPPERVAVERMASALAIRRFAGARMLQHEVAEYAWMVCCRREALDAAMVECEAWLTELCGDAERVFLEAMQAIRPWRAVV